MFAIGLAVPLFFNGDDVQRIDVGLRLRFGINDNHNARGHRHEIRMRHRHTRAVAQAEHEGLRVPVQPLADQI